MRAHVVRPPHNTLRLIARSGVAALIATGACKDATDTPPRQTAEAPSMDVGLAASWTIHVLSIPGCTSNSVAADMSEDGRIVGHCGFRGFEWFEGTATWIDPPGASSTYVTAVANGGYVAGTSWFGTPQHGWVRRPDGRFVVIRDAAGTPIDWVWPTHVTPGGLVVGWRLVSIRTGQKEAFKWSETLGFQRLVAPGLPWTAAYAVNDVGGIVVGQTRVSGATGLRAARWTLIGGYAPLPPIGSVATAIDINASSTILGNDLGGLGYRPVVWTPTSTPSLVPWPAPGEANDITNLGRVTGFVHVDTGGVHVSARPATSRSGIAEVLPMPFWALHGKGVSADRCGSIAGTLANDDLRDGRYAPTIERAVLWRRVGCDR